MRKNQFSIKNSPQMLEELKNFVENVKTFLFYGENPQNYWFKISDTSEGLDFIRITQMKYGEWCYRGERFNNEFLARSASFIYQNTVVCKVRRTKERIVGTYRGAINECLREALSDIDTPWHRPEHYSGNNGLQYSSKITYRGQSKIRLEEFILDVSGMEMYRAQYVINLRK